MLVFIETKWTILYSLPELRESDVSCKTGQIFNECDLHKTTHIFVTNILGLTCNNLAVRETPGNVTYRQMAAKGKRWNGLERIALNHDAWGTVCMQRGYNPLTQNAAFSCIKDI